MGSAYEKSIQPPQDESPGYIAHIFRPHEEKEIVLEVSNEVWQEPSFLLRP
jgi:hypothetical protein